MPSLAIDLFGPIRVLVDSEPLPRLRSRKALWLLSLMTLRDGKSVTREWLARTLWPDADQSVAFANLRPVVSELRQALGKESERLSSPDRSTIALHLDGVDVDVLEFDAVVQTGSDLKRAVALYKGPLLEGCLEEWSHQERNAREVECLKALQFLGEEALQNGLFDEATSLFSRAVAMDSWLDAPRRGLMNALAGSGNVNAALHVYREFAHSLSSEAGLAPDAQTSELYARLRAQTRSARRSILVDGEKGNKGVSGSLPHALTSLVGREDERLDVAEKLRSSRLVTLTGLGGIGKTRLATAVATDLAAEFPDGVWLVPFESLADEHQLLQAIASLMDVRAEYSPSLRQGLRQILHTKRLLLVLDNCEHLLQPCAVLCTELLVTCANLRILATSREGLGITGEKVWPVPALPVPDARSLPESRSTLLKVLMSYEGVQLFVERARAVTDRFELNGDNALVVAQICQQLDGIPLAIELAAARVKAMPLSQIAARLADHLNFLTLGSRVAPTRQQTLRSTLDWSYALLDEDERTLFHRLSIFSGGWTLEAAEGICSCEDLEPFMIADLLSRLVDKSLVVFEPGSGESDGRYRFLEMVRQYSNEGVACSKDRARLAERHRKWFADFSEQAAPHLQSAEQEVWTRRLRLEYPNLRQVMDDSVMDDSGMCEESDRVAIALSQYWENVNEYSEGERQLLAASKRTEARADRYRLSRTLLWLGVMHFRRGSYHVALSYLEDALTWQRLLGDSLGIAESTLCLGKIANRFGHVTVGRAQLEECLRLYSEAGDVHGIATCMDALGHVANMSGRLTDAHALFSDALALHKQVGDYRKTGWSYHSLGAVAIGAGNFLHARAYLEDSLPIFEKMGDRRGTAWSFFKLGTAILDGSGDADSAEPYFAKARQICTEIGAQSEIPWMTYQLGVAGFLRGNIEGARRLFDEASAEFDISGDHLGTSLVTLRKGNLSAMLGDYPTARTYLVECLSGLWERGDSSVRIAVESIALLMADLGQLALAVSLLSCADAYRISTGVFVPVYWASIIERKLAELRSALGEEKFTAEWDAGRAIEWDCAVAMALGV